MKTLIKTIVLPALVLIGTATQVSAQTKRSNAKQKTVVTTTKRTTTAVNKANNRRVSSTKVIYKKPTRKVVSVRSIPNKTIVKHKGQNYYYANNKFYTQSRRRYIVIAPKV